MYKMLSKLIVYKQIKDNDILYNFAEIFRDFDSGEYDKVELIHRIYTQINRLLDIATVYGYDNNLWHNHLSYIIATTENPFSISCEKYGARDGSVNSFAKNDFKVFKELFDYDFSRIEKALEVNCFSVILNYQAVVKNKKQYNKNVSDKIKELALEINNSKDECEVFDKVTTFYKNYGVGLLGLNKAFRIVEKADKSVELVPITNTDEVVLDDLVGYEIQKGKLLENTLAFVNGNKANNCLLYGDSGTGKSTSIKAILNQFYPDGLRIIEIYKHQFVHLSQIISQIKNRNYRFIIYMDDLSFEEFEIEYKYLKAVIEGGLETKPENVLIYATSNRRHLIKETWSDRDDMEHGEIHRSDTIAEKLSLVARFGVKICYSSPDQKKYFEIVTSLAKEHPEITLSKEELIAKARVWELQGSGRSGRSARQLIDYLSGTVLSDS